MINLKFKALFIALVFVLIFLNGCSEKEVKAVKVIDGNEVDVPEGETTVDLETPQEDIPLGPEIESEIISDLEDSKINSKELSVHNSLVDCWVSYDGKVYDITDFLPVHPGSAAAILSFCGTSDNFKMAFENQHGTSKIQTLINKGTFIGDFE